MRIRSKHVVLGGFDEPLRIAEAAITIEGSTISRVDDLATTPPQEGDMDVGDALVTPAFVDAHTHLAMIAFRGLIPTTATAGNMVEDVFFRLEGALQPGDIRAFTRMGALEALQHGTGFVWDHYYAGLEVAEGLRDIGMPGVVAPTLQDLHGPGVNTLDAQLDATLAIDQPSWLQAGIGAALGPHATDSVSGELWATIVDLAERHRLPIHTHVAQSFDEVHRAWSRDGASPLDLLERRNVLEQRCLLTHLLWAPQADLQRIHPQHVLGACPHAQVQFGFPARFDAWTDAGLNWACGSDASASNDAIAVRREPAIVASTPGWSIARSSSAQLMFEQGTLEAAQTFETHRTDVRARHESSWSTETLLRSVWSATSRLHPSIRAGVIEAGAIANLLIFRHDHPCRWPNSDPLRSLVYGELDASLDQMVIQGMRWTPTALASSDRARAATEEASRRLDLCLHRAGISRPW